MANVFAQDKHPKDGQPRRYHVEQTETWEVAKQVAEYVAKRVDTDRWTLTPEYAARTTEPDWPAAEHMRREEPNIPHEPVEVQP